MGKASKYFHNPALLYLLATAKGLTKWVPDTIHLSLEYKIRIGSFPNLTNPKTFNEKIQWLKLHDRNPLYTKLVDKYAAKEWVANRIGPQYVTETYACWNRAEDIDISGLPERFVLKTNHDCGGIAICRDRSSFDLEAARKKLAKHLRQNYYWGGREWPYKNVTPCVFAEEYLESNDSDGLPDYKVMCFGGNARCVFTCTGRAEGDLRVDFYDLDWNHLPFTRHYPNADASPEAPSCLREMLALSERLAEGIPFVRVDFYEVANSLYFGEMTFYPGSGFEEFSPEKWDENLGSWIELPSGGGWLLMNDTSLMWLHADGSLGGNSRGLTDFKFYCFDGRPAFLYVSQGLEDHSTARISFLNPDWSFAPFSRDDYMSFEELPEKPVSFDKMVEFAKTLSDGIPFVRVDFYEVDEEPRFSEMTFHPCSGYMPFQPTEWDLRVGEILSLEGAYGPFGEQGVR